MHMHNVTVLLCSQHAHAFPHSNRPTRFYHADMHVHVLKSCQILKHAHACTIRGIYHADMHMHTFHIGIIYRHARALS